MGVALLIGANPQRCSDGPPVRLITGNWVVEVQGLVDSKIWLYLDNQPLFRLDPEIQASFGVQQLSKAQLKFEERGTETCLNISVSRRKHAA